MHEQLRVWRVLEREQLPPILRQWMQPCRAPGCRSVSGRGSAQAWTVMRAGGPPVAVISAADADALRALLGPLPHYGAKSWLVLDGRRMLDHGVWGGIVCSGSICDG